MNPELFFNALSDSTRLRCLALLQQEEEMCVCELAYALQMRQPKISHHLARLRKLKVVLDRRAGVWMYYRLHPELPTWAYKVLQETIQGIQKVEPYYSDRVHLNSMSNWPDDCESGSKARAKFLSRSVPQIIELGT